MRGTFVAAMKIATWNVNSIRARQERLLGWLTSAQPDVLCLQETKCPDDQFPLSAFRKIGYEHVAINGQKGYHGVATIARHPIELVEKRRFCGIVDSRHLSVKLTVAGRGVLLHNFYVPAGGDEPDPDINLKFKHKLGFVEEMRQVLAEAPDFDASILVGDLNIAPLENDVWSH